MEADQAICVHLQGIKCPMPSEASVVSGDQSVEELRRELAEAREEHAATAEILRIISSSPTDPQRVFAEIAASATRLCEAYDAVIRQVDGEVLRAVAHHGPTPIADTLPLTGEFVAGRAALDRRTIHIADLQAETLEYPEGSERARRLGYRTNLAVPLIRAGKAIGVITFRRIEARLFSDRQIALLETFANQAVIAIREHAAVRGGADADERTRGAHAGIDGILAAADRHRQCA
jgi:two-component system, NtrC family, sensor kinase